MAKMALTWLLVAGILAVASAGEAPTLEACEKTVADMNSDDFIARSLGGSPDCVGAGDKTACCEQILGLFGEGGEVEMCMCNEDFFSTMMTGLPGPNGIESSSYADLLEECGVPVAGKTTCPGVEVDTEIEPKVQGQVIKAVLLKKALKKKALIAAAAAAKKKKPARGGGGGGGVATATATTPPPPIPAPVPPLPIKTGGKKSKPVMVVAAPAKKAATPTKKVATPAPAPVAPAPPPPPPPPPPPAPPVAPKVTAPVIAPKVTAPAIVP